MTEPKFAMLDGNAVRYTDQEAWWFAIGEWRQINAAEVFANARVMTEKEFAKIFGDLQALPKTAFQDGSSPAVTPP